MNDKMIKTGFACLLWAMTASVFAAAANDNALSVIAFKTQLVETNPSVTVLGQLTAQKSVALVAKVSDQIVKKHYRDGELVRKGQLLIELDAKQELAQLEEISVLVEESNKQYVRVKNIATKGNVTDSQIDERYREWKKNLAKQKVIEAQLADRQVIAPFDGKIGLSLVHEGDFVQAGTTVVTLDDQKAMLLDIALPEIYLANLQPGLLVSVESAAYPEQVFKGQITAISPQLDPVTRLVQLRALVENTDLKLQTNMVVSVKLDLPVKNQLQIPNNAILMLGDYQYVYRLKAKQDGMYQAEKVSIKTGQIGSHFTEVITGLNADDLIVSQGIMRVNRKQSIKIKGYESDQSQAELLAPLSQAK